MFSTAEKRRPNSLHDGNSLTQDSLEHLVLQSGDRALQNMVYVFSRQLHEDDLKMSAGQGKKLVRSSEYRAYEQNVRTLIAPHWQGPARGLKKHVRCSLRPFRKSSGLLNRLLTTPARITATACVMVLLGSGYNADASVLLESAASDLQLTVPAVKQEARQRQIIFADASLADLDTLLSSAPAGASVVLLNPGGNLISQMLDHLLKTGPADSLYVFTHGAPGQLQLGRAVIDQTTLTKQASQLNMLGTMLTGSRDIFLYGCQVAAGQQGNDFIQQLFFLTGADVAASDDFTGSAAKGGDWELELVTGNVDARPISSPDYTALLASYNPGHIMAGDGSGGGGGGGNNNRYSIGLGAGGAGGAGGGNDDTMTGTAGDDVMFGDGSGGGGGGTFRGTYFGFTPGAGGAGGSGNDTLRGGAGNDILFGDGFDGMEGLMTGGHNGVGGNGGAGGFGGGGGGGGGGENSYNAVSNGGDGGIGGGGGGGGDYSNGGDGGFGGGGGGAGGSSGVYGISGGFNATDGKYQNGDAGGGGGGGGFAGGIGGPGGIFLVTSAGPGGTGGSDASTSTGGGIGGGGGSDYGGGGGGGGFGGGNGGLGGDDDDLTAGTGKGGDGTAGGTAPITLIDNLKQDVYYYVQGKLGSLAALGGGAGDDILDGGPGSDDLFGMGGTNTFVFESDDATSGGDLDSIYDWNNGTANQIKLTTGGTSLNSSQVAALVLAQTAAPTSNDRSIIFQDGANQVTIEVLGIKRDLVASDFDFVVVPANFPWRMFMPPLVTPKK